MKKIILPILAIAGLIAMPVSMFGVEVLTDQASATATVLSIGGALDALTLTAGDMNFGSFTPDASVVKTVVLATDGGRGASTAALLATAGGTASLCRVTGTSNVDYTVTNPEPATLTRVGGTQTMIVSAFTITAPSSSALGTVEAFADSRNRGAAVTGDEFSLGATLTVGISQAAGTYSGNFNLTIAYI